MAAWQKMGVICINADIQGVCQQCLWLEWNPARKYCLNEHTCLCPKRQEHHQEPNLKPSWCAAPAPWFRRS